MEKREFTGRDKMEDLIFSNYTLLNVLGRFGISLGVGGKSIEEVCSTSNIDCRTFLAVVNALNNQQADTSHMEFSVEDLLLYLKNSHAYFIEYRIPTLRAALEKATASGSGKDLQFLILNYYDDYAREISKHMTKENEKIFPYVQALITQYRNGGGLPDNSPIQNISDYKNSIDIRLEELIEIIVKYYSFGVTNELNTVLYDIFVCHQDIESHQYIENALLSPRIARMESEIRKRQSMEEDREEEGETLSEREKDVLLEIVNGLSNKEIAKKMFLSVHTVNTHRKNIMHKLNIHSPAGLTIYAIVNGLISLDDIKNR